MLLSDLDIAARTIWGEARGTSYLDRVAIAWVLRNRLEAVFGQFARDDTLASVCLRHKQFSIWTPGDPNFIKIQQVSYSDWILLECMSIITSVMHTSSADPTFNSKHYHTPGVTPSWSPGPDGAVYKTDGHLFFNNVR